MSSEASNWVRDHYGGSEVAVAFVIATYTDREGRGCRASIATIAAGANKSARQVKRDLAMLRKEGIIAPGDQRLVAHLHPEQRPVVYDLPAVADLVSSTTPPRGRGRHHPGDIRGQDPVSPTTPKTSPSERDRAERAQGSAPHTGAAGSCPAFIDDGDGRCTQCGFPEANQRHRSKR
jgi:hypothetical protein